MYVFYGLNSLGMSNEVKAFKDRHALFVIAGFGFYSLRLSFDVVVLISAAIEKFKEFKEFAKTQHSNIFMLKISKKLLQNSSLGFKS